MDKVIHAPIRPGLVRAAVGEQPSPVERQRRAAVWRGLRSATGALVAVLAAGVAGSASAALVTHTPDAGPAVQMASTEAGADADRPLTDLLPPGLLVPKAIDLLLDMHVDAVNLAYTPMEAAASAVIAGGLDVRSLNPHVPANPMFPGYGLSYEPPPADGAGRQAAAVQAAAAVDGGANSAADRGAAAAEKAEAAEPWQDGPRDRLADARDWIADHRMELLVGMGVAVVLGAAVVASRSRLAGASTRGRSASSRSASRGSAEGSSRRSSGRASGSGSSDARGTR